MVSPTSIEKYKRLYLREFGVELSKEDAAEQAQRLLSIARVVMQPMPMRLLPRYKELFAQTNKEKIMS